MQGLDPTGFNGDSDSTAVIAAPVGTSRHGGFLGFFSTKAAGICAAGTARSQTRSHRPGRSGRAAKRTFRDLLACRFWLNGARVQLGKDETLTESMVRKAEPPQAQRVSLPRSRLRPPASASSEPEAQGSETSPG